MGQIVHFLDAAPLGRGKICPFLPSLPVDSCLHAENSPPVSVSTPVNLAYFPHSLCFYLRVFVQWNYSTSLRLLTLSELFSFRDLE